jgi:hypothetical protein
MNLFLDIENLITEYKRFADDILKMMEFFDISELDLSIFYLLQ